MRNYLLKSICVLFLAGITSLWSQQGGVLSGKITGTNGAGMPNATVTITNTANNASQKVLTGPDGGFTVSGLQPGTYQVTVEMTGYKQTVAQNVTLGPGNATGISLNLTLEPGNANEVVEVNGTSPNTQDNNGEVGTGLGMRPVQELPIVDRNHQQLAGLEPGVTPPTTDPDLAIDPQRTRFYSTDGQAPYLNQYYFEGLYNSEPTRDTANRVIPEEAIEQTNLTIADPTMQKGFTGGAFFMDNMRQGTNAFHGSLFEFWNGDILDTRTYFDTLSNGTPRLVYNQFGATGGGAIQRDRTFLYGSYEGSYQRGDQVALSTVPTTAALTGNFSGIPGVSVYAPTFTSSVSSASVFRRGGGSSGVSPFAGNVIPSAYLNPSALAIANFFPSPNLPGLANNYISSTPFQNDYQKADARLDRRFGDHTNLFLRYGYSNDLALTESPLGPIIGSGTNDRLVAQNSAIGAIHDFGPHLISEFRFGYNRYAQKVASSTDETPVGSALGYTGTYNSFPSFDIPGLPALGPAPYLPEYPTDNTFNWVWSNSYVTSHHHFQFGLDVRRIRSDGFLDSALGNQFGPNGTFVFGPGTSLLNNGTALSPYSEFYNSFASFLMLAPTEYGAATYLVPPSVRETQYGFWVGDTLQLLHRVTVDVGARYEVYTPLQPSQTGGAAVFDPTNNTFNYSSLGGTYSSPYTTNWGNIAPRIGLAVHVTDKTVVRAGYSIQYFEQPYMFSGLMTPMAGTVTGVPGTYNAVGVTGLTPPLITGSIVNGASADNLPVSIIPRTFDTSSVMNFHAQVERQFLWGTVLNVGYLGALGRHLLGISELNESLPGTGVAGLPYLPIGRTGEVLGYNDSYTSNYNALQASLQRRFAYGISFLGSYTYSKALDYTGANNMILDPFNTAANYGPADWDRQQVLTISHLWELPFLRNGNSLMATLLGGWQLNGIFTWATGTPLTFTADNLACGCINGTVLATATTPITTTGNYGLGQSYFAGTLAAPVGSNIGNLGRGILRGPGYEQYNMSLFKNFHVHERYNFQIRGEAYNIFNSTQLLNPVTNINAPNFGQIPGTVGTLNGAFGRQINLALRVQF